MSTSIFAELLAFVALSLPPTTKTYDNTLIRMVDPKPILADHPDFVAPIKEVARYEAATLVDDDAADLDVRAWRFSYNARGIIEMPNKLRAAHTAVTMVHPWGIDDGQGWITPEPCGVCDFCTPTKNALAARHTRDVIAPFIASLRGKAAYVLHSLPGKEDAIRKKLYRSVRGKPTTEERKVGTKELAEKLKSFRYRGEPIPAKLSVSTETPVVDYFRNFPGLDSGAKFNGAGFWDLPIPLCKDVAAQPEDVVIYDGEGYETLRQFLIKSKIRHVLLVGYATDMCYGKTTAGYENLSKDFDVFLVGDATLATFPANDTPAHATNAAISYAALNHLITQVSWVKLKGAKR